MKTKLLLQLALGLLMSLNLTAHAAQAYKVTATTLNVRSGPGSSYSVIGTVLQNQVYVSDALSADGLWANIWYNDKTYWVSKAYLLLDSSSVSTVAYGGNVRSGASTAYSAIGTTVQTGKFVSTALISGYDKIYYAGQVRYAHHSQFDLHATPADLVTTSVGFIQLAPSSSGHYAITTSDKLWGVPRLIYATLNLSEKWKLDNPTLARIGVNDISYSKGGTMAPHSSHKDGIDVDFRLLRNDGVEGATDINSTSYSSTLQRTFITNYMNTYVNIRTLLFADPQLYGSQGDGSSICTAAPVATAISYVTCWSGHNNHTHMRTN